MHLFNLRLGGLRPNFVSLALALALAWAVLGLSAKPAHAVPAFAEQIGQPCQACHVGGFGPQLTPFGRAFKLGGYTQRSGGFTVPFSAMLVASYINTAKDQNPPTSGFHANDNFALDQISLFIAGGLGSHLGAFVQTTYDGIARAWTWDNLDLRATTTVQVKDINVVLGTSLNNSPTVQDAWNTLPAWGYPYTSSGLAPGPATGPLMNGALAQTSLGWTGYAWINSAFYVEGGGYWSPSPSTLIHLGADPTSPGDIHGVAPYGRLAYQTTIGAGTLEVGAFGMQADIHPGLDNTTGFTDRFTDLGLDASYQQTLKSGDVVTANARYMNERQTLNATCALDGAPGAPCVGNNLNDFRIDGSYYWRNKVGVTVAAFDTTGNANPVIYAANRTFKPDSSGFTFQLDGTPWGDGKSPLGSRFNMRAGIQYTLYTSFNGAASNWDGAGAKASDNNTLRVFTWFAY